MNTKNIFKNREYVNHYENSKYGGRFGRYLKRQEISIYNSMIDSDCKTILDIGSGTGKLSKFNNTDSYLIVSADSSYEMLQNAKSHIKVGYGKYIPVVCNAESICFPDRSFDCVVASRLLMHLSDWKSGLSEICRVSKKYIVFDFPSSISFSLIDSVFKFAIKLKRNKTICYNTFLVSNILNEIRRNGFGLLKINKYYFLPILVHRILNSPEHTRKIESIFEHMGITKIFGSSVTIKAARNN